MTPEQKRRLRFRARKRVAMLLEIQGGICYWCDQPIFEAAQYPLAAIENNAWLRLENGSRLLLATVDHIIPISAGGGNQADNLVAACYGCNQKRSKTKAARHVCGCGKPASKRRRRCNSCWLKRSELWLQSQGWVESHREHWRDPETGTVLHLKRALPTAKKRLIDRKFCLPIRITA
jgi:hypothetical protein